VNKDTFIKLIKFQGSISQEELTSLDDVLKSFPACNAANILMAKGTFDKGSMFSNQKVKRAALFAPSREVLKRLIYNQNANTNAVVVESRTAISQLVEVEALISNDEEVVAKQEEPVVFLKEEKKEKAIIHHTDNDDLVDEIYKNLSSLKSIRETVSEIDTHQLVAENSTFSEPSYKPAQTEKKTPKESVAQSLKYYVHTSEFDKTARKAGVDLISEYLAYRNDKSAIVTETSEVVEVPDIETQINIIQKFIEESPSISKPSPFGEIIPNVDLSQKSTKDVFDLVTETLANLLVKQEKYKKAIEAFEKLILKYPDKSAYFAQKIEFTKSLIK
jgi:tetratricopeptide (TPR) repeat protein